MFHVLEKIILGVQSWVCAHKHQTSRIFRTPALVLTMSQCLYCKTCVYLTAVQRLFFLWGGGGGSVLHKVHFQLKHPHDKKKLFEGDFDSLNLLIYFFLVSAPDQRQRRASLPALNNMKCIPSGRNVPIFMIKTHN